MPESYFVISLLRRGNFVRLAYQAQRISLYFKFSLLKVITNSGD